VTRATHYLEFLSNLTIEYSIPITNNFLDKSYFIK